MPVVTIVRRARAVEVQTFNELLPTHHLVEEITFSIDGSRPRLLTGFSRIFEDARMIVELEMSDTSGILEVCNPLGLTIDGRTFWCDGVDSVWSSSSAANGFDKLTFRLQPRSISVNHNLDRIHQTEYVLEVDGPEQETVGCVGCRNYHGQSYHGNFLVCGMHPYGWQDEEKCPDYEEGESESPVTLSVPLDEEATRFFVAQREENGRFYDYVPVNSQPIVIPQYEDWMVHRVEIVEPALPSPTVNPDDLPDLTGL